MDDILLLMVFCLITVSELDNPTRCMVLPSSRFELSRTFIFVEFWKRIRVEKRIFFTLFSLAFS